MRAMGRRRFLARIRTQAAAEAKAEAKTARPAPAQTISTDGITIRVRHLAIDPVRSAEWLVQQLGLEAASGFWDALEAALATPQRPAFKAWLEAQPITDDAAGDFIRDARADRQLPDGIG